MDVDSFFFLCTDICRSDRGIFIKARLQISMKFANSSTRMQKMTVIVQMESSPPPIKADPKNFELISATYNVTQKTTELNEQSFASINETFPSERVDHYYVIWIHKKAFLCTVLRSIFTAESESLHKL